MGMALGSVILVALAIGGATASLRAVILYRAWLDFVPAGRTGAVLVAAFLAFKDVYGRGQWVPLTSIVMTALVLGMALAGAEVLFIRLDDEDDRSPRAWTLLFMLLASVLAVIGFVVEI